jgi:hypothetical protein
VLRTAYNAVWRVSALASGLPARDQYCLITSAQTLNRPAGRAAGPGSARQRGRPPAASGPCAREVTACTPAPRSKRRDRRPSERSWGRWPRQRSPSAKERPRSLIVGLRQVAEAGIDRTEPVRSDPGAIRSRGDQVPLVHDRLRSSPRLAIELASPARRPVLRLVCHRPLVPCTGPSRNEHCENPNINHIGRSNQLRSQNPITSESRHVGTRTAAGSLPGLRQTLRPQSASVLSRK